ncbi:MAG TPA: hypothetical protein VKH14_05300 [Candidatus Udaeobacter sp.]|nr:hypothetical protein [Candidatus Udaeobacter sp.]
MKIGFIPRGTGNDIFAFSGRRDFQLSLNIVKSAGKTQAAGGTTSDISVLPLSGTTTLLGRTRSILGRAHSQPRTGGRDGH